MFVNSGLKAFFSDYVFRRQNGVESKGLTYILGFFDTFFVTSIYDKCRPFIPIILQVICAKKAVSKVVSKYLGKYMIVILE